MSQERILVVSHGHPDFSLGGGEIAAYQLFRAYQQSPAVDQAWFLARKDNPNWPSGAISLRRENEFLWDQAVHDWVLHRAVQRDSLHSGFADLIRALSPTIVHLHHYAHLGLDMVVTLRQLLPQAGIFLTLHEYMAMCRHNGQMVKTGSLALCKVATPGDCARCYPDSTEEDFWLRQTFIMDRLALIDGFVAPSEFLRQRYIAWGLPPDRIVVIENGQPKLPVLPPRALLSPEAPRNRFAFFGQINPYKGLDVLLKALNQLPKPDQKKLVLEVHAAHLERQPVELRERIAGLLEPLVKRGTVQWIGPYRPEDMCQRLAGTDWVLVPSIWWENSPLVIQEALGAGRPVLCSDIGGMAEKIRHNVDGLHVPVGHALAWGDTLVRAATEPGLWARLAGGIRPVLTHQAGVEAHLRFFEDTLSSAAAVA